MYDLLATCVSKAAPAFLGLGVQGLGNWVEAEGLWLQLEITQKM